MAKDIKVSLSEVLTESVVIELMSIFTVLKSVDNLLKVYFDDNKTHKEFVKSIEKLLKARKNCNLRITGETKK